LEIFKLHEASQKGCYSLWLIRHLVWKIFSFLVELSSFGTCSSMCLTTNKPPSLGLISSSHEDEKEMWEEELLGSKGEECSLSTCPLRFKVMVLFNGQLEAMCPYPKHLKHLMELVLESWEELGVSFKVLAELDLEGGSWEPLEGYLSCFFSLPFKLLE